jgi:VIT1/CCC1 family predicted Fe2+/Mn2+ transporter
VLGANDGIVSVAGVLMGVVGAGVGAREVLIAGVAATVAGAFSMGGGEYVSVSAQKDTELSHGRTGEQITANPFQAAASSFLAFTAGAILPMLSVVLFPSNLQIAAIMVGVAVSLTITGVLAARAGNASPLKGAARIVAVSVVTMGFSYLIGLAFGVAVL